MKSVKRALAIILALVIIFVFASCSKGQPKADSQTKPSASTNVEDNIKITVDVIKSDKTKKTFEIQTTADNLEDALVNEKLVEGDKSEYGLYIKVVDGERADYSLDNAYWSLSKDGVALANGANQEKIADGNHYEITYTLADASK